MYSNVVTIYNYHIKTSKVLSLVLSLKSKHKVIIMNTYNIEETTAVYARRSGNTVQAKDLASAKRKASKAQCFHGTVMNIFTEDGSVLLAYKSKGKWIDC